MGFLSGIINRTAHRAGRVFGQGDNAIQAVNGFVQSVPKLIQNGLMLYAFSVYSIFLMKCSRADGSLPEREVIYGRLLRVFPAKVAEEFTAFIETRESALAQHDLERVGTFLDRRLKDDSKQELLKILIFLFRNEGAIDRGVMDGLGFIASGIGIGTEAFAELLERYAGGTEIVDREACYRILGISSSATPEEIRKAYRDMSAQAHPDRHMKADDDERHAMHERFLEIGKAYRRIRS
ncbi:MAG: J domain-containing protein [Planctomycetes bacterium]|nr:J domain-containing protein [Planctomycetota bacterium]